MNKNTLTISLAGLSILSACDQQEKTKKQEAEKPNILFVFTDQQTIDAMSAYGNPYLHTPYMDDLARFGVRFTRSYCTSPVCGPSRSSLITSRMPHETKVNFNGESPDWSITNMGEVFSKAGYKTIWAGKWHLPDSYPYARGLDSVPGFDLLPFATRESINGRGNFTDGPLADAAADWIKSNPPQPFLMGLSFHNPHDICYVPTQHEKFNTLVNSDSYPPVPGNWEIPENEPEFVKQSRQRKYYGNEINFTTEYTEKEWRWYLWHYYRMTERVDREIGKVIEALEYAGLDEKTLIIFTSDHGDGAASHKWAAKLNLYEEAAKVPLIITWFGKTPEGLVDSTHLVSGLDVLPTMCDYAGVTPPKGILGKSLKSIIDDPGANWRKYLVTELAPDPKNPKRKGRMVRSAIYKYNLYSHGNNNEQFYNLKKDSGEMNNQEKNVAYKKEIEQHMQYLEQWMQKTNDDFKIIK